MEQGENIMVSICTLAYNHGQYIRQCLDGIVMQQTNFKFELLIHDDASTDDTADIIREYERKYPQILKPIYQTENQYSKGISVTATYNMPRARGKYIAVCEGDDYWTDPLKLQKQVDFLESHPEYSMCFHKCMELNIESGIMSMEQLRDLPGTSSISDLADGNYIHTPSVVYRNISKLKNNREEIPTGLALGDIVQWMLIAQYGKIWKMNDIMAIYRSGSGIWSPKPLSFRVTKTIETYLALYCYFEHKQTEVADILKRHILNLIESSLQGNEQKISSLLNSKDYRLGHLLLLPIRKIVHLLKKTK